MSVPLAPAFVVCQLVPMTEDQAPRVSEIARRRACALLLLSSLAGCYHWTPVTPYVGAPVRVRIVRRDGERLDGTLTRRTNDSIYMDVGDQAHPRAVAIGDIRTIEGRALGPTRTVLLA